MPPSLFFDGIPGDVPEPVAAVARTRLARAFDDLAEHTSAERLVLRVGRGVPLPHVPPDDGDRSDTAGERVRQYVAEPSRYRFDQLVIPAAQAEELQTAVAAIGLRSRIYGEWGLREIEPSPSAALNLHGPPGTGKTLAAHAIADRLGRPIIMAGYAEIESKFHGDGPKNVKTAFQAAESQGAVLFVDEADSLLSRRLTDVTQGSEQAINSMRSQIVLCLDRFTGVVVFSTNLVENYDRAFESRVRHFHFTLPDPEARAAIWGKLLVPDLPLDPDVDVARLCAETDGFSGREIKLAILTAAERAAVDDRNAVSQFDLETAIGRIRKSREQLNPPKGRAATPEERDAIEAGLAAQGRLDRSTAIEPGPAGER